MGALFRTLLYGGLSAEEYDAIRYDKVEANRKSLLLYAPVACIVFCILSVASLLTRQGPPSTNHSIYLYSCLAMGIITACTHFLAQGESSASARRLVSALTYAFIVTLHVFSIALSLAHPEYPAVSAIVFLLVNPLLLIDRPIRAMLPTIVAVAAICLTSAQVKDIALATDDAWNAITFGAVALAVDVISMKSKLSQLFQAREIAYLSKTDALTQLRNRNNYESRLEEYPHSGAKTLACAYADANGLRELNNTEGHDAGDELLRAIARQMRKRFGEKNTFRIGGDEFVAIVPNGSADDVRRKLRRMQEKLSAQGYSVSCGAAEAEATHANMRSLVREAEKEMYAQKREHHANDSHQTT